jgi:O-Antigen ligase
LLDRIAAFLFLATLALLPWGGIVRFPWLHENAQWSDALFALATLAWAAGLLAARRLPRIRMVHAGLALYLGWAALSLVAAHPRPAAGPAKLLGVAMLVALAVVTSEMMARPGMPQAVARTITATSLLTAVAAAVGVALSYFGHITLLVGPCGDLLPGPLSRAQAGFTHPNLLASWCVFASGVAARADAGLSRRWRKIAQAALAVTVVLTTSRAILAFGLSAAIRGATTPLRRRLVAGLAVLLVIVMAALTVTNLVLNPFRPWEARLSDQVSPRLEAVSTSLHTLALHPLLGTGPGTSPGYHGRRPFDAHLTPLNVAATLGLPALLGLVLAVVALWRARSRPTDRVTWGMLAGLGLDGLGQDIEDFRHVWVALGLADAGRAGEDAHGNKQA